MTTPLPKAFTARPIAHRALHGPGRPENSRAAVSAAVAAGYAIEIDLQMSADGVAMVFHDRDLHRLTGERGPIGARPAAALRKTPLRGGDDGIPSFADILALVDGRVPLLVEIKDQTGTHGPGDGRLERAAAADLAGYGGEVAVMSFSTHSVASFAEAAPHVPRGCVTRAFSAANSPGVPAARLAELARLDALETLGASFVSHRWQDLGLPRVAEIKSAGLPVLCWTTRSPGQERRARRIADGVTFEGYLPA